MDNRIPLNGNPFPRNGNPFPHDDNELGANSLFCDTSKGVETREGSRFCADRRPFAGTADGNAGGSLLIHASRERETRSL